MKTISRLNVIFTPLFIFLLTLASCTGDPVEQDPVVETLIPDFEGNDGVSVDLKGNIYISAFGAFENGMGTGKEVLKVNKNGKTTRTISGLNGPLGNVTDVFGNLYLIHDNNPMSNSGKVLKISPSGRQTVIAEIPGFPSGITLDPYTNTLYIANFAAPTVHQITSDGTLSVFATDDRLAGCVGIDINREGDIITANFSTAEILSISSDARVSSIVTVPDTAIIGYMTILDNHIYATALSENKILKIAMNGTVETFAGNGEMAQKDGTLLEASFTNPNGIGADTFRKILYISEFGTSGGLRKIQL